VIAGYGTIGVGKGSKIIKRKRADKQRQEVPKTRVYRIITKVTFINFNKKVRDPNPEKDLWIHPEDKIWCFI